MDHVSKPPRSTQKEQGRSVLGFPHGWLSKCWFLSSALLPQFQCGLIVWPYHTAIGSPRSDVENWYYSCMSFSLDSKKNAPNIWVRKPSWLTACLLHAQNRHVAPLIPKKNATCRLTSTPLSASEATLRGYTSKLEPGATIRTDEPEDWTAKMRRVIKVKGSDPESLTKFAKPQP